MIRQFEKRDTDRVNELLREFNYSLDSLNGEFAKILVSEDDKINGVLVYDLIYDRIEIEYIVVDKLYRRQGIASKLINFIENNDEVNNITLEVRKSNEGAIKFYEFLGFKKVAVRKNYYKNEDGILMMK